MPLGSLRVECAVRAGIFCALDERVRAHTVECAVRAPGVFCTLNRGPRSASREGQVWCTAPAVSTLSTLSSHFTSDATAARPARFAPIVEEEGP